MLFPEHLHLPVPIMVSFLSAVGWFELEDSKNTNVYVTGLPFDITEEEYTELMSKYGIIKEDDNGACMCVHVHVVCACV